MLTGMLVLDEIFTLVFCLFSFLLRWALYLFLLLEKFPGVMQAFEHLLQRELICFADNRGHTQSIEFRPAKLLITSHELHHGLKAYRSCPVSCYHISDLVLRHLVLKILKFDCNMLTTICKLHVNS